MRDDMTLRVSMCHKRALTSQLEMLLSFQNDFIERIEHWTGHKWTVQNCSEYKILYGISSKMKTYIVYNTQYCTHSCTINLYVSRNGTISTDVDFDRIEKKYVNFLNYNLMSIKIKIITIILKKKQVEMRQMT